MKSWSRFELLALAGALILGLSAAGRLTLENLVPPPQAGTRAVGTLVYKLRTAETKHSDQAVWQTLPQNSTVYDQDTVRTASESSADVVLGKSARIALGADTMVRLTSGGKDLAISRGSVRVKSSVPITVRSGQGSLVLKKGEALLASDEGRTTATLIQGSAALVTATGENTLKTGTTSAFDVQGGRSEAVPLAALSPTSGAELYTASGTVEVEFDWTSDPSWKGRLIVADNPALKNPRYQNDVGASPFKLSLPRGTWWWTLQGKTSAALQKFEVKELPSPKVIHPRAGEIAATDDHPEVDIRWLPAAGASSYRVEIGPDASPFQADFKTDTPLTSATVPVGAVGAHAVRIIAVFDSLGLETASRPLPFTIGKVTRIPLRWNDNKSDVVNLNQAEAGGKPGTLTWKDDGISRYRVRVAKDEAMTKVVSDNVVGSGTYKIDSSLPPGQYFIEVGREGETPETADRVASLIRRTVVLTKPVPPSLISPVGGILTNPQNRRLSLVYRDPNGASRLQIELSADRTFQTILATAAGRDGTAQLFLPDKTPVTLYWRADALDDKGESLVVSTVEAFRIPRQLPKPRILAPAPGSIVDLAKIGEVNIVWTPVADANVYQVTLFRALAGYRTKVRSWETSEAFLLWNDFLQLSADTYTLEISALLVDQDKVVIGQSLFGKSAFKLEQSVKVKPVKLELSPEISPN